MSVHERKAIRDAAVQALTGHTSAGANVFPSRKMPIRRGQTTAIGVYTESDETDADSADTAPRELRRTVRLAVDCWVTAAEDDIEDALDAIALEVETAWDVADADDTSALKKATFWSWPASTEMGLIVEGDKPFGCAHMVFECVYHSDPRFAIGGDSADLKTIDTKYRVADGQLDADQTETKNTGLDT